MSPTEIIEARSAEDFAEGRILIEEYAETLGVDLCFQNFSDEIESIAKAYGTPRGCLLLARKNSELAGCVAVRSQGDVVCEMKRLYVRPQYRGVDLGRLLAKTVIRRAQQLGYSRMILDTLPSMTEARFLYESLGFQEIEGYYQNPLNGVWYLALELVAP